MFKNILSIVAFAIALGILVYVGSALLQTINLAHFSPTAGLFGFVVGIILGAIFIPIARRHNKEPLDGRRSNNHRSI